MQRIINGRSIVSTDAYERAGAKVGPSNGVYEKSFTPEGGTFPEFVQVFLEGTSETQTIEHCLKKTDVMSSSKKKKYHQLASPLPLLYYYE